MSSAIRKWWIGGVLVAAVALLLMPTSCAYSPANAFAAVDSVRNGFPDFRLVSVSPIQELGLGSFDAASYSGYTMLLESRTVPGFRVWVRYLIDGAGYDAAGQTALVTHGMFSGGTLNTKDLLTLQRRWVASRPGQDVAVGLDTATGPGSVASRLGTISPRYSDTDLSKVYCLQSGSDIIFYELDRTTGRWTELEDFLQR